LGLGLGLGLVGLGLASQASRVFLPRLAIHTAMGEASRVYSISQKEISGSLLVATGIITVVIDGTVQKIVCGQ